MSCRYFIERAGVVRAAGALRPISACVLDEASQCVEPEALLPLRLGVTRLVLVGDPEQLPATVTSNSAREQDYQQSLFNRLHSFLAGGGTSYVNRETNMGSTPPMVDTRCPVLRLTTQYRMHSSIASWPNR